MRWILAALVVSLTACGAGSAVPTPSGSAAVPTPSATPTASPRAQWEHVALPSASDDSAVTGIVATATGFVAVGLDGASRSLVWRSADGLSWTAVARQPAFENALMAGAAARAGRIVAVGRDVTASPEIAAAAWVSDDGTTWRRAAIDGSEGAQMIRVIAGGPGFIAVGSAPQLDAAAVWTSVDGERWQRVPHGRELEHAFIWGVSAAPTGFVAVGWRRDPEPSAAAWTSPDGRAWSLAPRFDDGAGYELRAVTTSAGRLVAAGSVMHGGQAAMWTSSDGRAWRRAATPPSFTGAGVMALLPLGELGIAALGGREFSAAAWTSRDGDAWTPVEDAPFAEAHLTAGAAARGRIVAVGATQRRIPGTGSAVQRAAAWHAAAR